MPLADLSVANDCSHQELSASVFKIIFRLILAEIGGGGRGGGKAGRSE